MFEELKELYKQRKREIKLRLLEFRGVMPREYFYEMVYCLLTPQTSARSADKAVKALQIHRFHETDIDPLPFLHSKDYYIRFHHTKAKRLVKLKDVYHKIIGIIGDKKVNAFEKREYLVSEINGYGLKEATHFLRNIGKNDGLAILDRHIIRNLHKFGAIDTIPKILSTKNYYRMEREFNVFAEKVRIPLDELDLLFWSIETGIILK